MPGKRIENLLDCVAHEQVGREIVRADVGHRNAERVLNEDARKSRAILALGAMPQRRTVLGRQKCLKECPVGLLAVLAEQTGDIQIADCVVGIAAEALERRKVACDAALVCDANGGLGKDRQIDELDALHAIARISRTLALLCRAKVHDARKVMPIAQQLDVLVRALVQVTGADKPAVGNGPSVRGW